MNRTVKLYDVKGAEYRAYRVIVEELEQLNKINSIKTSFRSEKTVKLDSSKGFLDKSKRWSGQEEIAALLAYQLYVKAQSGGSGSEDHR